MAKKSRSQVTAEYEARLSEKGGGRFPTMMLSPEEMAAWEAAMAQDKGSDRGKAKRTLMRALEALEQRNEPSNGELIEMLKARLK